VTYIIFSFLLLTEVTSPLMHWSRLDLWHCKNVSDYYSTICQLPAI